MSTQYAEPKHLLWALLFLKVYASEQVIRKFTGADEKTSRKWIWLFIGYIEELKIVSYAITTVVHNVQRD